MAKSKFNPAYYQNFTTNAKGELTYDDETWKQINARNDAIKKYQDTIKLKQQIQSETEAIILENQKEIKKKSGMLMQAGGAAQTFITNPRSWAKGVWGLGQMIIENPKDVFIDAPMGASQAQNATKLFEQSAQLNSEATKLAKIDKAKSDELFKQSQDLYNTAQESYNKANENLGRLTTGKQIAAKAALTGLDVGSFLIPGGLQAKATLVGGIKGTSVLSKVATKVPATLQASKTVRNGNILSNLLGLGDIYQGGAQVITKAGTITPSTTIPQLFKGATGAAIGMGIKSTAQAFVYGTLEAFADEEEDNLRNIVGSITTTGVSIFALTAGFGFFGNLLSEGLAGNIAKKGGTTPTPTPTPTPTTPPTPQKLLPLPQEAIQATTEVNSVAADKLYNQANKLSARASKLTDKTKADELIKKSQDLIAQADKMPKEKINIEQQLAEPPLDPNVFEPKAQVIGTTVNEPLPNPYAKLGAFNPETDIPMVDLTETIKANNIDFNPDSVMSINATRKAVDDLALLTGNEVGGKKLKINTDDPKYIEIYNNQIIPLIDRINKVNSKVEVGTTSQPAKDIITVYHGGTAGESPYKLHRDFFMTTSKKEAANYARRKHGEDGMITKIRVSKQDLQGPNDALIAKKGAELYLHEDGIYRLQPPSKQQTVEKVPVEDVEMEVQKIYSELENAGISITPEQVRYTPNIQAVDEKLAKGEIPTPDEFNKGMQEYVNSTGKTEIIDGVQEELTGPMKRSAYVERLNKENPGLDLTSVEYQSAIVKDLEANAMNLIDTNFDEAGRIARSINKNSNLQEIKVAELYNNKLIELGKYDELAQTSYALSVEATRSGQRTGILQEKKMGTPEYAIKQAQNARINKLKPQVEKEVVKVKQEMSSVKVDQTFLFDILDNITCK